MKRFAGWVLVGAVAIGGGGYWKMNRGDRSCCCRVVESDATSSTQPIAPSANVPTSPPPNVVETILLFPEAEVAPMPELVAAARATNVDFKVSNIKASVTPRPEAMRDERPWMPYAPEDRELSDTRRLTWAKASVRDAQASSRNRDLEETQEQPLLEDNSKNNPR